MAKPGQALARQFLFGNGCESFISYYLSALRALPATVFFFCSRLLEVAKQQRGLKDSPGEPRAPKGGHGNAKKTPEDPKRCQKTAGGFPTNWNKIPK
jgi:hypothetical protein